MEDPTSWISLQLPDPDIPETNGLAGVAVILQLDGPGTVFFHFRKSYIRGGTPDDRIVLQQDTVL